MKCVSCSFQEMIMKVNFTVMITTKVVGYKRPLKSELHSDDHY